MTHAITFLTCVALHIMCVFNSYSSHTSTSILYPLIGELYFTEQLKLNECKQDVIENLNDLLLILVLTLYGLFVENQIW